MATKHLFTIGNGYECPDLTILILKAERIICTSGEGGAGELDEVLADELY
jgi:hypothetical protein